MTKLFALPTVPLMLALALGLSPMLHAVQPDTPADGAVAEQTSSDSGSGAAIDVNVDEKNEEAAETAPSLSQSEQAKLNADLAEFESLMHQNDNSEISFNTSESSVELVSKDQPNWLNLPDDEALIQHRYVVASKLYFSSQETEGDLDASLRQAVDRYVNNYLKDDKASLLIRHDADFIRSNLVKEQFDEVWNVKQFNKNMYRRHALIEFNDNFRSHLDAEWRDVVQTSKVLTAGLTAFGVLSLLGVGFTYLRVNNATGGCCAGRLKFLSAAAILALGAAGALFANVNADWLRWM